jgi:hypothetical protein
LNVGIDKGEQVVKRVLALALACIISTSITASSQTRRRSAPKRNAAAVAAEKQAAELQAGRARVAEQIKTLTQFLYLLRGVTKDIESADLANRGRDASPLAIEQNQRSKAKVRESIRSVREGLDKLESSFYANAALRIYYHRISGVARIGEMAENKAATYNFDEAGRLLIKAVGQLADALVAVR